MKFGQSFLKSSLLKYHKVKNTQRINTNWKLQPEGLSIDKAMSCAKAIDHILGTLGFYFDECKEHQRQKMKAGPTQSRKSRRSLHLKLRPKELNLHWKVKKRGKSAIQKRSARKMAMGEKEKNLSQECITISQLSYRFADHIQAICVIKKKRNSKISSQEFRTPEKWQKQT